MSFIRNLLFLVGAVAFYTSLYFDFTFAFPLSFYPQCHPTPNSHLQRMAPSSARSVRNVQQLQSVVTESISPSEKDTKPDNIWSRSQLDAFAAQEGVVLSISKIGPVFRAVARASHNTSLILGYVEGGIRPPSLLAPTTQILHFDSMRAFPNMIQQTREENTNFRNGGTILGVGLLLGYLCCLDFIDAVGDRRSLDAMTAEFLAIDDEKYQHERLVKYYATSGFKVIKYVGDDWKDVPDRLIWGGCGTLLRQNIGTLLKKWTILMERSQMKKRRVLEGSE